MDELLFFSHYSESAGEVALHRLNWLKVWVLPPRGENVTAKGISWRPDGKVLAVGYSNCKSIYIMIPMQVTKIQLS